MPSSRSAGALLALLALIAGGLAPRPAAADAQLLIEVPSGKVLHAENATMPWYPASLTKLMTSYVTLQAVREGRLKTDTLLMVSANALAQQPSKMGFPVGTQVTVDNALKMLMVKSANDMAVVLAEGVAGSVPAFASEMNAHAQRLGMTQSHFNNPNGLPDDGQITSARDLGILVRALIRDFPEYGGYWDIAAIKFGKRVMRNYNPLIGRYPGADGMKTGFICASGFNLAASATRDGRRLVAIVLGAPSGSVRAYRAAQLLEKGFSGSITSWLTPSLGTVDNLVPILAAPPNLKEEVCGKHRKRPAAEDEEDDNVVADVGGPGSPHTMLLSSLRAPAPNLAAMLAAPPAPSVPVVVTVVPVKRDPSKQIAGTPNDGTKTATKRTKKKNTAKKPTKKPAKQADAKTSPTKPKSQKLSSDKPASSDKPKDTTRSKPKDKSAVAAAPKS